MLFNVLYLCKHSAHIHKDFKISVKNAKVSLFILYQVFNQNLIHLSEILTKIIRNSKLHLKKEYIEYLTLAYMGICVLNNLTAHAWDVSKCLFHNLVVRYFGQFL